MILKTIKKNLIGEVCFLCGNNKTIDQMSTPICKDCLNIFSREEENHCEICGHPKIYNEKCDSCERIGKIYFDDFRFIQYYTGFFKNILYRLKLREDFLVIKLFYEILILKRIIHKDGIITAVPDNFLKKIKKGRSGLNYLLHLFRIRGFNTASEIFRKRVFAGKSQKLKVKNKRIKEIENKYFLPDKNVSGFSGRVYLIDDIYTTGSTLNHGAKLLKEAGFDEVIAVSFFRARLVQN